MLPLHTNSHTCFLFSTVFFFFGFFLLYTAEVIKYAYLLNNCQTHTHARMNKKFANTPTPTYTHTQGRVRVSYVVVIQLNSNVFALLR